MDANWQYLGNEAVSSTPIPSTQSTASTASTTLTNPATNITISTPSKTIKQQSVGDQPASPRTASRTTSLPLDVNNVQITESGYVEQILQTSKDVLDPNLFALELDEIADCYNQSIYVFFLVSNSFKKFLLLC